MRNCLAVRLDHIARCLDDLERVFSIRHCGRRVATVSLFRPALLLDFDVEEVRGKANSAVSEAIVALAEVTSAGATTSACGRRSPCDGQIKLAAQRPLKAAASPSSAMGLPAGGEDPGKRRIDQAWEGRVSSLSGSLNRGDLC